MAVNHFAHFLLTHHLLDTLKQARAGRVIIVSSMAHQNGQLDMNDLALLSGSTGYDAYCASKLANVLYGCALAKRLSATRVTANSLHPGVVSTKLLWSGFRMKGSPVERGARTSVYLATSDEVAGVSGTYFVDCRKTEPTHLARDEKLCDALWQASERVLAGYI
jgi:NAD(P)-dependent dehydrogenase (short-subunit alcohol dehydrogenase family)